MQTRSTVNIRLRGAWDDVQVSLWKLVPFIFSYERCVKIPKSGLQRGSPRGGKILKAVGWSWGEIGYYVKNSKGKKCKKLNDRSQEQPILSSGNGTDVIPAHMFTFFIYLFFKIWSENQRSPLSRNIFALKKEKRKFKYLPMKENFSIQQNEANFWPAIIKYVARLSCSWWNRVESLSGHRKTCVRPKCYPSQNISSCIQFIVAWPFVCGFYSLIPPDDSSSTHLICQFGASPFWSETPTR